MRLLPSLEVVAISQAPSPESDPNPPSPVYAMLVHYTNITADRAEIWMTHRRHKAAAISKITMIQLGPPRRASSWSNKSTDPKVTASRHVLALELLRLSM